MEASLRSAERNAGLQPGSLRRIAVSSVGPVDVRTGVVTTPPNLAGWRDVPVAAILGARFGVEVLLENDGNAGALGEHRFGAGRGTSDMVYIGLGTGFGAGIIARGQLYSGSTMAGGELGHTVVNAFGRPCKCGNRGCIEAYCSGTALSALARDLLDAGRAPVLARMTGGATPLAEQVLQAAADGDADSRALVAESAEYFAAALASFVNAFSPERIVIGGGLANAWEQLVAPAIESMRRRAFPFLVQNVSVVPGELGARACAMGALAVALGGPDAR
jgi:glucokinase